MPGRSGLDIPQFDLALGNATEKDLAYIAGLFDGEGSIYMNVKKSVCKIEFQITSSNKGVLDWATTILGDYVYRRKGKTTEGYQPTYDLRIHRRSSLIVVLRALLPYLKIKQKRVEYALKLLSMKGSKIGSRKRSLEYWKGLSDLIDEANREAPPERFQPASILEH